jgi:hypothetical protein
MLGGVRGSPCQFLAGQSTRLSEVYLRIGEDNFYRIKDRECTSISIKRGVMKKNVSLPSAYMTEVFVSNEKEFNKAKKQIGF